MTNRPVWKCIAQIGDANPLEYNGYWIFVDTTGIYQPEGEKLFVSADYTKNTIYRFELDKCKMINGFLVSAHYDETWIHSLYVYDEWFHKDIKAIANFIGITSEELEKMFCSDDVIERARAYEAIGEYHGYENLDSYPLQLTRKECKTRYSQKQYQIKKG